MPKKASHKPNKKLKSATKYKQEGIKEVFFPHPLSLLNPPKIQIYP
jgi:hypothetical protein